MKTFAILALASILSIPGSIHGEKMTVTETSPAVGTVYQSNDGNLWATDYASGLEENQIVTVWMSDNETKERYDDIIVAVARD